MLTHPSKPFRVLRGFLAIFSLILIIWSSLPPFAQALTDTKAPAHSTSPFLEQVIERVTEFRLENGMKFIVMENHDAPVVSFVTYADVGGVDEPDGKTGVAHFLEHLAFKGTKKIGTTDYSAEAPLLDRSDELFEQLRDAKIAGNKEEATKIAQELSQVQAEAAKYAKQNEFGRIVEQAGGENLNAATSSDATVYFYSFPSNKLELWMSLESERFLDPVFREFYKEQQVILEERRLRTDNNPMGLMVEKFLDTAFIEHPYKRPVIGYDEDIRNLSRDDVQAFFDAYYPPSNLTVAIVGDVDPEQVKQLAKVYFGRYAAKPKPPQVTKVEPRQGKAREIIVEYPSQPWYLEGYHRPALTHPDNAIYDVIASLMSDGRTSRLYKSLVEEKQVALVAEGFNGFPDNKYPNLMLFYAQTTPQASVDDVAKALAIEIERMKSQPVSAKELERVKTNIRAALLRSLDSNIGMARSLTAYEVKTGSWLNLFKQLDAIAAVTPADIQRVAKQTFTPENRTIGKLVPPASKG